MNVLERLAKAKQLPMGHYERTNAKKAVEAEYAACHKQELDWESRLSVTRFDDIQKAVDFCYWLCASIGSRPIRRLVVNSPDVKVGMAHYDANTKSIHFKYNWLTTAVLVHETAHHIKWVERYRGDSHGKEFLEIEKLLFEVAMGWGR